MAVSSPTRRQTALCVTVICLLVGSAVTPLAVDTAAAQETQPPADNTVTRLHVFENGSARWTIQIRTRLDTEQRVTEYNAFQSRFRNDTGRYLDPFRSRMQGVVANAANATGREMRATNFTASTSIQEVPRRWGVVTYEFVWTNFATQANGQVVVGDVFQGGFFIAANDSLQLVAPAGYEVASVDPTPDSREPNMVTWTGREDFADTRPRVAFAPAPDQGAGSDDGATPDASPAGGDTPLADGLALPAAVVVLFLLIVGAVLYGRRTRETGTVESVTPGDDTAEATSTADTTAPPADDPSEDAVLTDEERVLTLLQGQGGRMRQAAIANELDWSASKTSRVVGRLADDGSVEKLQLGRENLVSVADADDTEDVEDTDV